MGYDVSALARECFGCHVCVGDTVPLLLSSLGIARDLTESTPRHAELSNLGRYRVPLFFFLRADGSEASQ